MRRLRRNGALLLLLALIAAWAWLELERPRGTIRAEAGSAVRIVDGDSLRIGATAVRIAGIDAPELAQTCWNARGSSWPCGKAARTALQRLARQRPLICEPRAKDRFGRTLADCRNAEADIGAEMIRLGLALDARDPRFARFEAETDEARRARRGVWQGRHQHPAEWRAARERRKPTRSSWTGHHPASMLVHRA